MAKDWLILITDLDQGGAPQVVRAVARGLTMQWAKHNRSGEARGGVVVSIAPLRTGGVWEEMKREGIEVRSLGVDSLWGWLKAWRRWGRMVKEFRPGVVYSVLIHANMLAAWGRLWGLGKNSFGYVHSIHTLQERPRWHWWVQRWILRWGWADGLIAVHPKILEKLGVREDGQKYLVIPNGVALERFRSAQGWDWAKTETPLGSTVMGNDGKKVWKLGFVGRFDPVKRLDLLLEAVAELKRKCGNQQELKLYMVGYGGQEESLKKQAEALGIGEIMVWVGASKEPEKWYKTFDIMILPSIVESFSMVLVESLAAGCAVVAVDSEAVRFVLTGGGKSSWDPEAYSKLGIGVASHQDVVSLVTSLQEVMSVEAGADDAHQKRQAGRMRQVGGFDEWVMIESYAKNLNNFCVKSKKS